MTMTYSPNWKAYCKANNLEVTHVPKNMVDFITWINKKAIEFRDKLGLPPAFPIGNRKDWIEFLNA